MRGRRLLSWVASVCSLVACSSQGSDDGNASEASGFSLGGRPGFGGTPPPSTGGPGLGGRPFPPIADAGTPPPSNDAGGASDDAGSTTDAGGGGSSGAGLAKDLTLDEVAVLQGVKVDVVTGHAKVATQNAPIVAGRDALIRAFVTPASGSPPRALVAELTLVNGGSAQTFTDDKTISSASSDGDLNTTFNFNVPGSALTPSTQFRVAVRDPSIQGQANETGPAQYPESGASELLGAQSGGEQLKVVLVPVRYAADGSNRVPDTSLGRVEAYRQELYKMYPVAKVDLTVRAAWTYSAALPADGTGWTQFLTAVTALRNQDAAAADVYYFGLVDPGPTFDEYCAKGCIGGLGTQVTNPSDALDRAAVGIGYPGEEVVIAHEVGHNHGRGHAPCGTTSFLDPAFPYADAGLGVSGYDLVASALVPVSGTHDVMSYCAPSWVSDYTYRALFDRIRTVNGGSILSRSPLTPSESAFRMVEVGETGILRWGPALTLTTRPGGVEITVKYLDASDLEIAKGAAHFYANDHLAGGYVVIPEPPAGARSVEILGLGGSAPPKVRIPRNAVRSRGQPLQ